MPLGRLVRSPVPPRAGDAAGNFENAVQAVQAQAIGGCGRERSLAAQLGSGEADIAEGPAPDCVSGDGPPKYLHGLCAGVSPKPAAERALHGEIIARQLEEEV